MAASYFLPKLVLNCFKFQKWTDSGWPQLTILTIVSCLWDSGHILDPSATTWYISVFFIVHILNNGCKITGNPTDIKQWTTDGISEKIKIIEVKQSVFFTFFFFSFWSLIAMSILKKKKVFIQQAKNKQWKMVKNKYINKERREDMRIKLVLRGKSSITWKKNRIKYLSK